MCILGEGGYFACTHARSYCSEKPVFDGSFDVAERQFHRTSGACYDIRFVPKADGRALLTLATFELS